MRILKNRLFHRWSVELGLSDDCLIKAIDEMTQGLYEESQINLAIKAGKFIEVSL